MTVAAATPTRARPGLIHTRLVGGVGGLLFVVVVIVQNLLRASAPADDATARQVVDFYATHHATSSVLGALFVVSGIGLVCFAAGMADRLTGSATRGPAVLGLIGVTAIVCLFATMLASDLALSRLVTAGVHDAGPVLTAWTLHEAAFCVLLFAIAVALAGLSVAATANGLVGRGWRPVGTVGAGLLAITAAMSPLILDGSPLLYLGLVGFAAWLAFVARSSVALLRGRPQ